MRAERRAEGEKETTACGKQEGRANEDTGREGQLRYLIWGQTAAVPRSGGCTKR